MVELAVLGGFEEQSELSRGVVDVIVGTTRVAHNYAPVVGRQFHALSIFQPDVAAGHEDAEARR